MSKRWPKEIEIEISIPIKGSCGRTCIGIVTQADLDENFGTIDPKYHMVTCVGWLICKEIHNWMNREEP